MSETSRWTIDVKPPSPQMVSLIAWANRERVCVEAMLWLPGQETPESAWYACERAVWLFSALRLLKYADDGIASSRFLVRSFREMPLATGRTLYDLLPSTQSAEAFAVAERYVDGAATFDEKIAAMHSALNAEAESAPGTGEPDWVGPWAAARMVTKLLSIVGHSAAYIDVVDLTNRMWRAAAQEGVSAKERVAHLGHPDGYGGIPAVARARRTQCDILREIVPYTEVKGLLETVGALGAVSEVMV